MRVLIGALILGLCAWRTAGRLEDWRSDEALWRAAVGTTPTAARPMLNLSAALVRLGRYEEAWQWTQQVEPMTTPATRRTFNRIARALHVVWRPICDDPARVSWCAWELGP